MLCLLDSLSKRVFSQGLGSERRRPHVAHLNENLGRSISSELLEIMDHVHLVVISEAVRDIQPRPSWIRQLRIHGGLETGDPCKRFSRHTDFGPEETLEVTKTQSVLPAQVRDFHRSMAFEEVLDRDFYLIGPFDLRKPSH